MQYNHAPATPEKRNARKIITQNKLRQAKTRFNRLLRHLAWKKAGLFSKEKNKGEVNEKGDNNQHAL